MFELVVPARNEEDHVGELLTWARSAFGSAIKIVVVDNASTDRTREVAHATGADEVVHEDRPGKGFAVITGLKRCISAQVMVCDADIVGLRPEAFWSLRKVVENSPSPIGRLSIARDPEDAPVTTLVARPLLAALSLEEEAGSEPLGGLLLAKRQFVLEQHLPGGWGFDVGCTIAAVRDGCRIPEILVSGVTHRHKPVSDYVEMANQVCLAILRATGRIAWDHADCTQCGSVASQEANLLKVSDAT